MSFCVVSHFLASSCGRKKTSFVVNNEMILPCTHTKKNKNKTKWNSMYSVGKMPLGLSCRALPLYLPETYISFLFLAERPGIRWNEIYCLNFCSSHLSYRQQSTKTEVGSSHLNIWECSCLLSSAQSGTKFETLNSFVQYFLCLCCLQFERNH